MDYWFGCDSIFFQSDQAGIFIRTKTWILTQSFLPVQGGVQQIVIIDQISKRLDIFFSEYSVSLQNKETDIS